MLEQLMGLIQDQSQDAIVKNPAIPNEHNTDAMQAILGAVTGGLQSQAQSGNISGLMGLLSGNSGTGNNLMNNPIVSGIAQNAIGSLMEKFGLSNNAAAKVIAQVLPGVLTSMISKTSNPNDDSMDFGGIMGSLLGGQQTQQAQQQGGFDFNQIGYALADGKLDMNDVMRIGGGLLGGGGAGNNNAGGGLGGLLGGLFGK
ncbi:hypothetical protein [Runella aurantiaca]|uniref:DUF937 domain-containing protein n=1 Tax=Runella aurantiaca TaxID=2282308 RepID=A0A369I9C0_9BACT|nr:hypothetical protein [Runella aurantiaca]RDB06361.1 hypothetical protein DVG78_08850 [Runella aurantiaca]